MIITEITQAPDLKDVDLAEDLEFFMRNNPSFYRRVMWPIISKMKQDIKSGKGCKEDCFRPCVDQGALLYCKKFNIPDNPKSVFTNVDRDSLARKIFDKERINIEKGIYDGRDE
jgi:hypothetical protein